MENHVHTIFCSRQEDSIHAQKYPWTPSEKLGSSVLKCFGSALALALNKYKVSYGILIQSAIGVHSFILLKEHGTLK